MGNNNSLNEVDRKLNSTRRKYNFLTSDQERELIELYKDFDTRNDPRFGRIQLFKNQNGIIIAKIQHAFYKLRDFERYFQMYMKRKIINCKYLLQFQTVYSSVEKHANNNQYFINLFIKYPYNDLKNEIDYRLMNQENFSINQLMKILKAGIIVLTVFEQNSFNFNFTLNQYSICLFHRQDNSNYKVQIMEFNIKDQRDPYNMDANSEEKCRQLALIIIEAGLLLNQMLYYQNQPESVNLRKFDQFMKKYQEISDEDQEQLQTLLEVVKGFLLGQLKLLEAYSMLFEQQREDQKYILKNMKIVSNENFNRAETDQRKLTKFKIQNLKKLTQFN